jgi:protein TonB
MYMSLVLSIALHGLVYVHFKQESHSSKSIYSKVQRSRITLKTTNHKYLKKPIKRPPIKKKIVKRKKKAFKLIQPSKDKISKSSELRERSIVKAVSLTSGQKDLVAKYLSIVRQSILKNKFYPRVARKLKLQGEVIVTFAIRWPNTIEDVRLLKMTPHALLNESALNSVTGLSELAQMPAKLKTQVLRVQIPLVYRGL